MITVKASRLVAMGNGLVFALMCLHLGVALHQNRTGTHVLMQLLILNHSAYSFEQLRLQWIARTKTRCSTIRSGARKRTAFWGAAGNVFALVVDRKVGSVF